MFQIFSNRCITRAILDLKHRMTLLDKEIKWCKDEGEKERLILFKADMILTIGLLEKMEWRYYE